MEPQSARFEVRACPRTAQAHDYPIVAVTFASPETATIVADLIQHDHPNLTTKVQPVFDREVY